MPTRVVEALLGVLTTVGPGSGIFFSDGPSPVVAKRNQLVERYLNESPAAWAFLLDTDMVPEPEVLPRLLAHGREVVGALYFARYGPPFPYAGWHRPDGTEEAVLPQRGLQAVEWVASGALLVRRTVFERLGPPWFQLPRTAWERGGMRTRGSAGKCGPLVSWCTWTRT